jgi:hypothetical protein
VLLPLLLARLLLVKLLLLVLLLLLAVLPLAHWLVRVLVVLALLCKVKM